jgi:hypothetical protein
MCHVTRTQQAKKSKSPFWREQKYSCFINALNAKRFRHAEAAYLTHDTDKRPVTVAATER